MIKWLILAAVLYLLYRLIRVIFRVISQIIFRINS